MQNLTSYFSDEDFNTLMLQVQHLLDELEQLPHPKVKETVFDLLGSIDMMHREALVRMLLLAQKHTPELTPYLEDDFVIQNVLSLYELVEGEEQQESKSSVETANVTFIPLEQIEVSPAIKKPIWIPGGNISDIAPNTFRAQKFEDVEVLLCNLEGGIFALRNACLDSILPLSLGHLEEDIFVCPWHNCRYDVRTGEIQNGSGLKLETYPVKVGEGGQFMVGFNIPHWQLQVGD